MFFCSILLNAVNLVNDTVIADPQFSVTLPDTVFGAPASMCYEVHGEAGKYFNLISDTCTSVNAHFAEMPGNPRLNRMSAIGIRAVSSTVPDGCSEIEININDCTAYLDGVPVDGMAAVGDIRIRRFNSNRWRVSVPNCNRPSASMWVTCEGNMLRFRIARGSNLAPTSHGLLGNL